MKFSNSTKERKTTCETTIWIVYMLSPAMTKIFKFGPIIFKVLYI